MKPLFITFEGIDGCGKSTQAKRLYNYLKNLNIQVILTFEPGGTDIGKFIRKILLDSKNTHIDKLTELFLYMADRSQHIKEIIEPSLRRGIWVISDRFYDATLAYQGFGRGIDIGLIQMLNKKICGGLEPDITFLLDCPVKVAIERRGEEDRLEKEDIDFHKRVREGYLSLAKREKRFVVLDATKKIEEIEKEIIKKIKGLINRKDLK